MAEATTNMKLASGERYFSAQIAEQEREHLWPKVWLMACRLEEIPDIGDYIKFDIDRESFLVIRTGEDTIKAFYNVCQHRGRLLKDKPSGNTGKSITCPFHGWRYSTQGDIELVFNEEDFHHYTDFTCSKFNLKDVRVDSWAGWVFISMDPEIEPLHEYLAPVPEIIKNFDLEDCRIKWAITIKFPCNWKTVVNAFNENYHVATTHAQLNKFGLSKAPVKLHGKHAQFFIESAGAPGTQNLGKVGSDPRFPDMIAVIEHREEERARLLNALNSEYGLAATRRLRNEIAADAPAAEIVKKYRELHREEMEAAGAKWPSRLTPDDMARAGIDWHIFPNFLFLPSVDGALVYRARPDPINPESSFYDIWWIARFPEGKAPEYKHEFFPTLEAAAGVNPFLEQDFANLAQTQAGMHSRGFDGAIYNPVEETSIANFERVLDEYLSKK